MSYDDLTTFLTFSYGIILNNIEISIIVAIVVGILLFSNNESEVAYEIDEVNDNSLAEDYKQIDSQKEKIPEKDYVITNEDLQHTAKNIIKRNGGKAISVEQAFRWIFSSNVKLNDIELPLNKYIGYLNNIDFSKTITYYSKENILYDKFIIFKE